MKKVLFLFCMPLLCLAVEGEFLTPQVIVLKNPEPFKYTSHKIKHQGVWKKENALLRDKDGKILRTPDITCYEYCVLEKPLKDGEKILIGGFSGEYKKDMPSNIFKLNQVGNGLKQKKKYAYMGAWLGSLGALPLKHFAGKEFELRRSSDHKFVYKNTLRLRKEDPVYPENIPFTGEEVLELDYSSFNLPGKYYFYVEGIGRSMDFLIASETLSEAFYIHARGLYHKRCGIAKKQPFTAWESPVCHSKVIRGRFPGNDAHYRKGKGEKNFGFFDIKENRIDVKTFDLIKDNPPYKIEIVTAPGGWHDAADYDRRPFHLRIVSDLAAVYLMKPENFIDGQLNIPESGNGIPDILDEAAWGVKHLLAVQRKDGGVGSWFETTGHPGPGEGLPDKENRIYYVSAPSRNGTLMYAAAVSTLALAMKKAGAVKESEIYLDSAQKAWDFALDKKKRLVAWLRLKGKMISYMEEPSLYGEDLLRTGGNLYILTGKKKYLEAVLEDAGRIKEVFRRDFWRWSPLSWMMLALYPVKELTDFYKEYRNRGLCNADKMLADQENAYPYRTLWHASDAGWVHSMAWGNYHPLRRAMMLIAAHKLTGEEKYLTGAYLAN
ncbi:MAG: glycoside hydrolase family 9 protein, partial [Lentisphaeria bacterium]|nr:glycoside hydrolase family 9 protein [Lentisphaeria bacterium]